MPGKFRKPILPVLALLAALAAQPAMAAVLMTPADGGADFTGPTESGFTISATPGAMVYAVDQSDVYTGIADGAAWTVTATEGGLFTFSGLDVTPVGSGGVYVVLSGTPGDGGAAIVADLSVAGSNTLPANFSGVALSSLTISGFGYDSSGFNTTSGFNNVQVTEVMEPASTTLLALGVAGLGFARRGRRGA